jgi:rhodanese-related sulfurtransferase/plastocyanin
VTSKTVVKTMANGVSTALFVAALLPAASAQQTIVVGGSDGWVVKPGNAAYDDIIANVGDTLQFTYSSWYHDVMLVDNENCDFTNGQMVDETGDFAWTVEEPGTYIFACARSDHCSAGNQQVTVRVAGGGDGGGSAMCRPDGSACPILIDVRTLDEWNGGHASCATRVPVQDDPSLVAQITDLAGGDMSIPIVTYCYSGARAGSAETIISNAGFESVTNGGGFISPAGNDAVLEEMCTCNTPCASSSCSEDLDGDGLVNVNDLLAILSAFGSDGTGGGDVDDDGIVNVNDLLQLLSAFGSTDCAAGSAGGGGAVAAPCTYGEDCGSQQFTECGTMCPATCGQMPGMMCNMMCYNGFQCPSGQFWDENANGVGSGSCVDQSACSIPMPELPPGIAPGRPFLSAKTVPTFSQAVEQAVSDWVGMAGPDGKHNHDGRPGGDYGQEEEL